MDTIFLDHLSKTYPGGKQALKGISLSLGEGEVFGFLGPNGAGKTTTVKLLTGILSPTQGHCQVMGTDPSREPEKTHAKTGVVTEHAQMYDHLTGLENLLFYASIFGISAREGKDRAMALLSRLGLKESAQQKLSAYSTGMRQRLSLARALIHRPQVLFLDEPTSGLDPESAQQVNSLIKSLAVEKELPFFYVLISSGMPRNYAPDMGFLRREVFWLLALWKNFRKKSCKDRSSRSLPASFQKISPLKKPEILVTKQKLRQKKRYRVSLGRSWRPGENFMLPRPSIPPWKIFIFH